MFVHFPLFYPSFSQGFIVLQELAAVGVEGARESPFFRRELSAAATYLSLVNFEIESQRRMHSVQQQQQQQQQPAQ